MTYRRTTEVFLQGSIGIHRDATHGMADSATGTEFCGCSTRLAQYPCGQMMAAPPEDGGEKISSVRDVLLILEAGVLTIDVATVKSVQLEEDGVGLLTWTKSTFNWNKAKSP
jgi:hypothetical protein